jgi:hypothetical protein
MLSSCMYGGTFLVDKGFYLLSFEIGKEFMHIVSISSCFMVVLV